MPGNDAHGPAGSPGTLGKALLLAARLAFIFLVSLPVLRHPSDTGLVTPLQALALLAALASNLALASISPPRLLAGHTLAALAVGDGLWAWFATAGAPTAQAAVASIAVALWYGHALGWLGAAGARREVTDTGDVALAARAAELQRRYGESVAAHQAKREFVANMSHELRTPLNIIIGYTDMLQDEPSQPGIAERERLVTRIHSAATNLLHLVDMVLDLDKLDAGKIPVERLRVPMSRFVTELEGRERIPLAPGVRLDCRRADDLPVVETDPAKLTMILDNLIGNAIKFTERGTITVRVRNCPNEQRIEFEVEDTGPGIDPQHLHTIFEPFHQVERSIDNPFGGVGLGLAIVRRYVRLLGGTIDVRSTVGVGTCFTVRLPYRPQETGADAGASASGLQPPASGTRELPL